jgi:alkylation response protein AidB-like acyl-CoA dehydrogenase
MNYLETERQTLDTFLPGLDEQLRKLPFEALEQPDGPALPKFREAGGPSLLVPQEYGGMGATPIEAARIHRAIGTRSPSLGIAATMHNFSLATLVEYGEYSSEFLKTICMGQLLVASGFAEGRTGASILAPAMKATKVDGGYLINGSKKPCSLSRSMNLLTASIAVPARAGDGVERAVAIIFADTPGIQRRPFWKSPVLAGAESDELMLTDVFVPDELFFFPMVQEKLDPIETAGFLWFELLVSASYLGMASALVERAMASKKGGACEQTVLAMETETAMAALEGLAWAMQQGERTERCLARALFVRFGIQSTIERVTARSAELLGGIAFINQPEVAYLLAATRALAFHPPSRISAAGPLATYLMGGEFQLV